MANTLITNGEVTVTATGAVDPSAGLDISGYSGDLEISLTVSELKSATGTPGARIVLYDSVNAFGAKLPVCMIDIPAVKLGAPITQSWKRDRLPTIRGGTGSAVLRVEVALLNGGTPSLTLRAELIA